MNTWRLSILFCFILVFSFLAVPKSQAQYENLLNNSAVQSVVNDYAQQMMFGTSDIFKNIEMIPDNRFPEPFSDFEILINAPGNAYDGASVQWFVDGVEEVAARNKLKYTFTAGALGKSMNISATMNKLDGTSDTVSTVIKPVIVDVVVEGVTVVPHFYKGRPLPSRKSDVRAVVVLDIGRDINMNNLSYRWTLNNQPLVGGGVRGLTGINFEMPLDQQSYMQVVISDSTGVIAEKAVPIKIAQPEIVFYEDNSLRGTGHIALSDNYKIPGNKTTIRAVPYYVSPFQDNKNSLIQWYLNGRKIDNDGAAEPNTLVLGSTGSYSEATVSFSIMNTDRIGQTLHKGTTLQFGTN